MPNPKAFLDFTFASDEALNAQRDAYARCEMLIRTRGAEIGLDPGVAPCDLDEVGREVFAAWYEADPTLTSQGPMCLDAPPAAPPSRLVIEVFADQVPKTAENFLRLCDGSKGMSKTAKTKPLHYLHTRVHRIVRDFAAQMGDVTRGDGSGGDSIYGGKFNDEKPGLKIRPERGSLCMANSGKNANTSQFFVVLGDAGDERVDALAGRHVVFGRVADGASAVLDRLNGASRPAGSRDESPAEAVTVGGCGVL
ncbi:hypothetical protein HDU67_005919 [Dinochytrium kinnereticum]|nr:hypothetical protein HDU67_005919 [Dinochytrium kinnereticum]